MDEVSVFVLFKIRSDLRLEITFFFLGFRLILLTGFVKVKTTNTVHIYYTVMLDHCDFINSYLQHFQFEITVFSQLHVLNNSNV